ncbi:MAG: FxLYD domain-containing protein [Deltaproteobacteria bacterium]|jgi:hypothetical protein|nr:FxLYD domain-containing protein [Deltaproteobacteria bacterium]
MKKIFKLGLILSLPLIFIACSQAIYVPGETLPPTDRDVAQLGPGSLKLEVPAYQWSYFNGTSHMRVSGVVVNNTGLALQSVQILGTLHDQDGSPIAYGTCYVYPTYMPPGGQGSFEFVGLTRREKGLTHTRLVIVAQAQVQK